MVYTNSINLPYLISLKSSLVIPTRNYIKIIFVHALEYYEPGLSLISIRIRRQPGQWPNYKSSFHPKTNSNQGVSVYRLTLPVLPNLSSTPTIDLGHRLQIPCKIRLIHTQSNSGLTFMQASITTANCR